MPPARKGGRTGFRAGRTGLSVAAADSVPGRPAIRDRPAETRAPEGCDGARHVALSPAVPEQCTRVWLADQSFIRIAAGRFVSGLAATGAAVPAHSPRAQRRARPSPRRRHTQSGPPRPLHPDRGRPQFTPPAFRDRLAITGRHGMSGDPSPSAFPGQDPLSACRSKARRHVRLRQRTASVTRRCRRDGSAPPARP